MIHTVQYQYIILVVENLKFIYFLKNDVKLNLSLLFLIPNIEFLFIINYCNYYFLSFFIDIIILLNTSVFVEKFLLKLKIRIKYEFNFFIKKIKFIFKSIVAVVCFYLTLVEFFIE